MATQPLAPEIQDEILQVINQSAIDNPDLPIKSNCGRKSMLSVAKAHFTAQGLHPGTLRSRLDKIEKERGSDYYAACKGQYRPTEARPIASIRTGIRRYLLTAAQNDTPVHERFWTNLNAFAKHIGAEISVGGFSYQLGVFTDHTARNQVFAEAVRPHLAHLQTDLGGVVWCAEMNILPTAVRPLIGLDSYTRGRYGVFPHAKIQLVSVPAVEPGNAAIICTTGACTVPNYIEKKAGLKARFHHQIGATLVEIDPEGRKFLFQIAANGDSGTFQHFTTKVADGKVTEGHRVEAITWGDIHREKIDPSVARTCWGIDIETEQLVDRHSMVDELRPRHQFFHDLLDFEGRNHHRRSDHVFLFRMIHNGTDNVEEALDSSGRFLRLTSREDCQSVMVPSNHNDAYVRWLKETDCRLDPLNARFWMESNLELYRAIERGDSEFDVVRWAMARKDDRKLEDIIFLPRNSSYLICQAHGGIEAALHGDQGANGARGSPAGLVKVASRMNTGHTHVAAINDGVYTSGLCGLLDQGYNEGPSSWSQTQIVTYPNAKRTLVTLQDGRWRA
jgi:hypothetical protein